MPGRAAAARAVERELHRLVANRLNPLDYLRTDELGLSRIIADLLDPNAPHVPRNDDAERDLRSRTLTKLYNARPRWLDDAHGVLGRRCGGGVPMGIKARHRRGASRVDGPQHFED